MTTATVLDSSDSYKGKSNDSRINNQGFFVNVSYTSSYGYYG